MNQEQYIINNKGIGIDWFKIFRQFLRTVDIYAEITKTGKKIVVGKRSISNRKSQWLNDNTIEAVELGHQFKSIGKASVGG